MHGYGVNPNAPRFPHVIPTLLFRPLKPLWQPALAFSAWSFGLLYDFVFSPPPRAASSTTGRATAAGNGVWDSAAGGGSRVSWFASRKVGKGWTEGKVQRMNVWDQGQKAWEAPGEARDWDSADSMLDDDYV